MPETVQTNLLLERWIRQHLKKEANRRGPEATMASVAREVFAAHSMMPPEVRDDISRIVADLKSSPAFERVKQGGVVQVEDLEGSRALSRIREALGAEQGGKQERRNEALGLLPDRRKEAIQSFKGCANLGTEAAIKYLNRVESRAGEAESIYEFWQLTKHKVLEGSGSERFGNYTVHCAVMDLKRLSTASNFHEAISECKDSLEEWLSQSDQHELDEDFQAYKPPDVGTLYLKASAYLDQAHYSGLWKSMRNEILEGEAIPRDT